MDKETISFDEFRIWLTGLIQGKGGALPDLNDWKEIKRMLDKVVVEREIVTIPANPQPPPFCPEPWRRGPMDPPPWGPRWEWDDPSREIYTTERKTHWSFRQWDVSD